MRDQALTRYHHPHPGYAEESYHCADAPYPSLEDDMAFGVEPVRGDCDAAERLSEAA